MKNYLCIEGRKIEISAEQLEKVKGILPIQKKLSEMAVGDTFKIGNYEFIVLEHSKETTAVILEDLLEISKFSDKDCDFKSSIVKTRLEKFANEIAAIIGSDNIIEHTVDLTANDGLKDYGKTKAKMSLITADLYRRYVETLDEHKPNKWWWLATPYSTPKHGYNQYILCVAPSGVILNYGSYFSNGGVRPFCILNSNIFVS